MRQESKLPRSRVQVKREMGDEQQLKRDRLERLSQGGTAAAEATALAHQRGALDSARGGRDGGSVLPDRLGDQVRHLNGDVAGRPDAQAEQVPQTDRGQSGRGSQQAAARRGVGRKPERISNLPGELSELHYDHEESQNLRFLRRLSFRKQAEREQSFYLTKAQWLKDLLRACSRKSEERLASALADSFEKSTYCATRKLEATLTFPDLMKMTRDSKSTVIRARNGLEATGRLAVVTDYDWKMKRNKPNVYRARGYKIIRAVRTEEGDLPF
jgi:hypothetical protein